MRNRAQSDKGDATILVTAVGTVGVPISFTLFNWTVVVRQAIEGNLAHIRAY